MTAPTTIGAYLRAARRRRRVSIERAAEDTRIRADFIMRMESDEFDFLAPAYVRGFLRTYARFLRVEVEPLLDEFDRLYGSPRVDTTQIASLERRRRRSPREHKRLSNAAVAGIVIGGMLIALAIVGLVAGGPDEPKVTDDVLAELSPTPEKTKRKPSPSPSPTPEPEPSPSPTEVQLVGVQLQIVAATGDCWVDVNTDGNDTFAGTIASGGASETFIAQEGFEVVLGLPDSVELVINGENVGSPGGFDPITLVVPGSGGSAYTVVKKG